MGIGEKVVIVGGGPVGALAALYSARRGYETELYELRDDPNHGDPSLRPDFAVIPLALSERGITAISGAEVPNLIDDILTNSRDIYTRLIHTRNDNDEPELIPMKYGPHGECLHTLQREKITKHCLLALEKESSAKLFFNHKMIACDFKSQTITFENVTWKHKSRVSEQQIVDDISKPTTVTKPADGIGDRTIVPVPGNNRINSREGNSTIKEVKYDFLIGSDGTYSSVRQSLMRYQEVDFSQAHVGALWCDLIFPANKLGNYRMDSKCLHVWPADENIVMAQPDFDGSFRAGMVCDSDTVRHFEQHPEQFAKWFKNEFKGIVPDLLSEEEATAQFVKHQKIPLKSIKINKLGYKDSVLLLGDSSHTMTPFHAMGMNTGLEDVRVFFEQFRDPAAGKFAEDNPDTTKLPPFCPEGTIDVYTRHRLPDVHSMIDLAHEHYYELRHGVRSTAKRSRKIFDAVISRWLPFLDWTTLYARIQFGNERFSDVVRKEKKQTQVVNGMVSTLGVLISGVAIAGVTLMAKSAISAILA